MTSLLEALQERRSMASGAPSSGTYISSSTTSERTYTRFESLDDIFAEHRDLVSYGEKIRDYLSQNLDSSVYLLRKIEKHKDYETLEEYLDTERYYDKKDFSIYLEQSLLPLIRIVKYYDSLVNRRLSEEGSLGRVLSVFEGGREYTPKEIAEKSGKSTSYVYQLLRDLKDLGLVEKEKKGRSSVYKLVRGYKSKLKRLKKINEELIGLITSEESLENLLSYNPLNLERREIKDRYYLGDTTYIHEANDFKLINLYLHKNPKISQVYNYVKKVITIEKSEMGEPDCLSTIAGTRHNLREKAKEGASYEELAKYLPGGGVPRGLTGVSRIIYNLSLPGKRVRRIRDELDDIDLSGLTKKQIELLDSFLIFRYVKPGLFDSVKDHVVNNPVRTVKATLPKIFYEYEKVEGI